MLISRRRPHSVAFSSATCQAHAASGGGSALGAGHGIASGSRNFGPFPIVTEGSVTENFAQGLISPLQYEGTMDSSLFETWFEFHLLPSLPKNAFIMMDNASFHRKSRLYPLAQSAGMTLIFLPPYSPELNPIEHFWSWLKRHLRKTLSQYSSFDDALCAAFQGQ